MGYAVSRPPRQLFAYWGSRVLERGCSLCEEGQFEDLTAQAFPSTGIKITSRVCADLTAHPLPPTLLSHLIQTVAFAGTSLQAQIQVFIFSHYSEVIDFLLCFQILFQAFGTSLYQSHHHC